MFKFHQFYALLLAAGFIIGGLCGCSKDDKNGGNMTIKGTLASTYQNWTYVGSTFSPYNSNITGGKFSLTLSKPDDEDLAPLAEKYASEEVTVSPQNVNFAFAEFRVYINATSRKIQLKDSQGLYTITVDYIYVDKNVTITGTETWWDGDAIFDVKLKKGWNTWIEMRGNLHGDGYSITANESISPDAEWR